MILTSLLLFLIAARQSVSQLSSAQRQLLLDLHNQARSDVSPTAANMEQMEWNDELAQVAQAYSERCMFDHNPSRASQAPSFSSVGENLAITSNPVDNYEGLFTFWLNERDNYNLSTNACSDLSQCGHYTQIVWATSNQLGCGATRCLTVTGFSGSNALLLVCNYGPAGNFIGQRPYSAGASCSACPDSKPYCSNNICNNVMTDPVSTITISTTSTTSTSTITVGPNPSSTTSPTTATSTTTTTSTTNVGPNPSSTTSPTTATSTITTTTTTNTSGTTSTTTTTTTESPSDNNNDSSGMAMTSSQSFVFVIFVAILGIKITTSLY